MAENLYGDEPATPAPAAAAAPADGQTEGQGEGQTALIPIELCPGMKPGDALELRILRVLEKEYEVTYEPKEEKQSESASEPEMGEEAAPGPGQGGAENYA